jgi:hypothetical protein
LLLNTPRISNQKIAYLVSLVSLNQSSIRVLAYMFSFSKARKVILDGIDDPYSFLWSLKGMIGFARVKAVYYYSPKIFLCFTSLICITFLAVVFCTVPVLIK